MTVGLTGVFVVIEVGSATLTRRLFLDEEMRSFGEVERRLAFAFADGGPEESGERGCLRRGGPTDGGLVSVFRGEMISSSRYSSPLSSPIATHSPTSRNAAGCVVGPDGPEGVFMGCESDLGRPRAAAAHERRVDRLARSAASWSA
jgi:hypothetical protein